MVFLKSVNAMEYNYKYQHDAQFFMYFCTIR
jgi:hypothetical protein